MSFTPAQQRAISDHDHNLVVVAGAGSGKTRVLVERYIALLDANPDWSLTAIVAMTFTREAALEMRNRVRSALEARLRQASTVKERGRWSTLLGEMDSARITTIHGLCATILRANAAQAGLDPAFQVMEIVDQKNMLQSVIQSRIALAVESGDQALLTLFEHYDGAKITEFLQQTDLLNVDLPDMMLDFEQIYQQNKTFWLQDIRSLQDALLRDEVLADLLVWEPQGGFPVGDDKLLNLWESVPTEHDSLHSDDPVEFLGFVKKLYAIPRPSNSGTAAFWGGKDAVATARAQLIKLIERVKSYPLPEWNDEVEQSAAHLLVGWYPLIAALQADYRAEKLKAGLLDFDDLERMTAQLLMQFPDVRARYQGAAIRALLVDEFQDTNQRQWQIVEALAGHEVHDSLFVVGDPKQSIYAFRGADVRVFHSVRDLLKRSGRGDEIALVQSFRSHPGLVNLFNYIFSQLLKRDPNSRTADYQVDYEAMTAHRAPMPEPITECYAPLELMLLLNKNGNEPINADQIRIWEADEIASRIAQLVDDQAAVFDRAVGLRPCHYGDFAMLFRSVKNAEPYEQALRSRGIPYVMVSGGDYYDRQEIWDVMNVLKALYNPTDALALAAALRSPMFGFSDDLLLALRMSQADRKRTSWLWDALDPDLSGLRPDEREQVGHAARVLRDLRMRAGRLTIADLMGEVLAQTGFLATLSTLPGGKRMRANVEKLLVAAQTSGKVSLSAFTAHLENLTQADLHESEAPLETAQVVKLMTIHGSKGLEFPIVFLANAGSDRNSRKTPPLLYDETLRVFAPKLAGEDSKNSKSYMYTLIESLRDERQELEDLRLLYVAATRAQDCLIVSGVVTVSQNKLSAKASLGKLLRSINRYGDGYVPQDEKLTVATGSEHESRICIRVPKYDRAQLQSRLHKEEQLNWREPQPSSVQAVPGLLRPVAAVQDRRMAHLAATHLADLGGLAHASTDDDRAYYRNHLRRQIFDDVALTSRPAIPRGEPRIRRRQVGEVVHEALRYWRFETDHAQLDRLLRSYAWQHGIRNERDSAVVMRQAREMLQRFRSSDVYQEISRARAANQPFYPEIPFILRTEQRIIHGVIDLLYQRADGTWLLLDYKTSSVRTGSERAPGDAEIAEHARRYYLQVGAYAAAAQQELGGIVPEVAIYYIQYNVLIPVAASDWMDELQRLEHYIGEMLYR